MKRQEFKQLESLFQESSDSIFVKDLEGCYLMINAAAASALGGRRADEIIGKRDFDLVSEEQAGILREHDREAVSGEAPITREVRLHHRTFLSTKIPWRSESGEIIGVFGIGRDISESKRREERVKASEELLFQFLENLPLALVIVDSANRVHYRNPRLNQLLGGGVTTDMTREEVATEFVTRSIKTGEVVPLDQLPLARALQGEQDILADFEVEIRGKRTLVREWATCIRSPDGKVRFGLAFFEDLTEELRRKSELQNLVTLLQATLESTADALLVVDREGQIVRYNQHFAELWRMPSDILKRAEDREALGFAVEQVKHPEAFQKRVAEIYADPVTETADIVEFKDGRIIERYSKPHLLEGEVVGLVWSFRDVTEKKRAEARIEAETRRNAFLSAAGAMLNSSLDYEATLNGAAKAAVPNFADWCVVFLSVDGKTIESVAVEHVDKSLLEILTNFQNQRRPRLDDEFGVGHVIRTGESYRIENLTPQYRESVMAKEPAMALIFDQIGFSSSIAVPLKGRGRTFGAIYFARVPGSRSYTLEDLATAEELGRRAANAVDNALLYAEAQDSIRAREEFISVASHELRTPLTALGMRMELLPKLMASPPSEALSKKIELVIAGIRPELNQMMRLVETLLDFSRVAGGRMSLRLEKVDLGEIAERVVERMNGVAAAAGSQITLDRSGGASGDWDTIRIEQVLTNLISNAIKFGGGKPIQVSVLSQGEQAVLRVADQGIGISREDQGRIFGRFERAVSDKNFGGLGLGLYIAQEIVRAHGGTVSVDSEPGRGATFTVVLPKLRV